MQILRYAPVIVSCKYFMSSVMPKRFLQSFQVHRPVWDPLLGGYGQSSCGGIRFSPRLLPSACGAITGKRHVCQSSSSMHSSSLDGQVAPARYTGAVSPLQGGHSEPRQSGQMAPAGAWLITGGAGALALLAAAWFAASCCPHDVISGDAPGGDRLVSARGPAADAALSTSLHGSGSSSRRTQSEGPQIVLCTRSGRLSPADLAKPESIASLATAGEGMFASTSVTIVRSDMGSCEEAAASAGLAAEGAASVGLLHAAGTLMDATLKNQTPTHIRTVFAPKVWFSELALAELRYKGVGAFIEDHADTVCGVLHHIVPVYMHHLSTTSRFRPVL